MMTVIDQESPWLVPSSTLAATIHSQGGAHIIRNGTDSPTIDPNISVFFRPQVSASWPEMRFVTALTTPKLMMKDVTATVEASWKGLAADQRHQRPFQPDHAADECVDEHQDNELLSILSQPERDGGPRSRRCVRGVNHGGSFRRNRAKSAIPGPNLCRADRHGRNLLQYEIDELGLGFDLESRVVTALETDCRKRFSAQSATAHGTRIRARQDLDVVG
jgi:hypothetical protein